MIMIKLSAVNILIGLLYMFPNERASFHTHERGEQKKKKKKERGEHLTLWLTGISGMGKSIQRHSSHKRVG